MPLFNGKPVSTLGSKIKFLINYLNYLLQILKFKLLYDEQINSSLICGILADKIRLGLTSFSFFNTWQIP